MSDPRDNGVRYVGFTIYSDKRKTQHKNPKLYQSIGKQKWTLELRQLGLSPVFETLETVNYESGFDILYERELHWVRHFVDQGAALYNRPAGRIREQDLISRADWREMHLALTEIRNEVLAFGTFFKNAIRNTCKEGAQADKALGAIDEIRWLLEERFQ